MKRSRDLLYIAVLLACLQLGGQACMAAESGEHPSALPAGLQLYLCKLDEEGNGQKTGAFPDREPTFFCLPVYFDPGAGEEWSDLQKYKAKALSEGLKQGVALRETGRYFFLVVDRARLQLEVGQARPGEAGEEVRSRHLNHALASLVRKRFQEPLEVWLEGRPKGSHGAKDQLAGAIAAVTRVRVRYGGFVRSRSPGPSVSDTLCPALPSGADKASGQSSAYTPPGPDKLQKSPFLLLCVGCIVGASIWAWHRRKRPSQEGRRPRKIGLKRKAAQPRSLQRRKIEDPPQLPAK